MTVSTVALYPPGKAAATFKAGDFFLSTNDSVLAKAIRFGERRRYPHEFCWTNHAGRFIDGDGNIIEALSHGLVAGHIDKYKPRQYAIVSPPFTDPQRTAVFEWSMERYAKQERYGFLTIGCEALVCLTGAKLRFGISGEMICSGYIGAGNAIGGVDEGDFPEFIMPAGLAFNHKVPAP